MAVISWPGGLGQSLGDALVTSANLLTTRVTWFVHHTGSDSYDGRDARWPLATLGQAITSSSDEDIIVLLSGHTETIATALSPNARTVVGAGLSGGEPTVELTPNFASGAHMLTFTTGMLGNVKIKAPAQTDDGHPLYVTGSARVRGVYFEANSFNETEVFSWAPSAADMVLLVEDCVFESVATSAGTRAVLLFKAYGATAVGRVVMRDTTFDGGAYGFTTNTAVQDGDGFTWEMERVSLLNGSDVSLHASSVGYFSDITTSSSSRIYLNVGGA